MAESVPTDVVSGSTETPSTESSTADTQTGAEETQSTETQPQQPTERPDWRKRQKEDAELNAHVQSEIARARTRWQRQQLRARAATAAESDNPEHAREVVQALAAEPDELDEGEVRDVDWARAADRAQPSLERILHLDTDGRATNPYYIQLYQKVGRAEMDKRYEDDPVGFVNWVDDQIMELRVDEKVKKVTPGVAAALATDEAHRQLRGMPVPLGGSGGGNGSLTLQQYESMTFAERQKLRKENPRAIDDMIARASR